MGAVVKIILWPERTNGETRAHYGARVRNWADRRGWENDSYYAEREESSVDDCLDHIEGAA